MYTRSFQLGFGRTDLIDMETGVFPVVAATNGDASDKHILHVKGHQTGPVTPMFFNHDADPTRSAGQLTNPKVSGKSSVLGGASLHFSARLPQDGDGIMPDIRRDVARGIGDGDIRAMSIRWDDHPDKPPVLRSSLKPNHYAHTKAGEGGFYEPMFFERFVTLEVSIVGVGSDSAALIGRSRDVGSPQHVRDFYRVLVEGNPVSRDDALSHLFEQSSTIEGLHPIETASGAFQVPHDVALVWGASLERGEELAPELAAPLAAELVQRYGLDTEAAEALLGQCRELSELSATQVREALHEQELQSDLEEETAEEFDGLMDAKPDGASMSEREASDCLTESFREISAIVDKMVADNASEEEIEQRLREWSARNTDSREEPEHEEEAGTPARTASPDEQPEPLASQDAGIAATVAAMAAIDREAEAHGEKQIALAERQNAYKYRGQFS